MTECSSRGDAQELKNVKYISDVVGEKVVCSIGIVDENNKTVGRLVPVTKSVIYGEAILKNFTKWRNDSMRFFLTQFIATQERTKNWLEKVVLGDNKRLLFIVCDNRKNMVGHCGFSKLNESSAELDNLIRGEKAGDPRIMVHAERTLVNWIFAQFKITEIVGYIFSDNIVPMLIHKEIGFSIKDKIPLKRTVINEEVHWKDMNGETNSPDNKYKYEMSIKQDEFMRRNSNDARN